MDSLHILRNGEVSGARHSGGGRFRAESEDDSDTEKFEVKLRWELQTIAASSGAYAVFFGLLVAAFYDYGYWWLTLSPLIIYDLAKTVICINRMYKHWGPVYNEDLKEMIESAFMVIYYVRLIKNFS